MARIPAEGREIPAIGGRIPAKGKQIPAKGENTCGRKANTRDWHKIPANNERILTLGNAKPLNPQ
ncbi:hypothetical protein [Lysinibacillus xylanilyticus]|uniref:hypothetical protein n=1 Tax=Lysinibacillus xylanilyticus TaxID=582475 RepID=UPI002B24E384|nr:hypothetical protein [Lysinibacillus xylanilyticus]